MTGPVSRPPSGRVAIIGAGIAGLSAARRLAETGCELSIFEKSRGPGGRCATRRSDLGSFHHGVASFAARSPAFCAAVASWQARGWVAAATHEAAHEIALDSRRWVGQVSMNKLARQLGQGLDVHSGHTVQSLLPQPGGGWQLVTAEQGLLATEFSTVLLAVPAEQARPLCTPSAQLQAALQGVHSQPCWTLMLAWAGADSAQPAAAGPGPLPQLHAHSAAATVLAEVLDMSHLPGPADPAAAAAAVPATRWVLHAQAAWSRAHVELSADQATPLLLQALAQAHGGALPPPTQVLAHRWRYAQVDQPLLAACGWDAALRLGSAGDAWGGLAADTSAAPEGVERAWLSGQALAEAVLRPA